MPSAHPAPDAELGLSNGHEHEATLHSEAHELQPLSPKANQHPHSEHHYGQHLREEWHTAVADNEQEVLNFWHRFTGKGRWVGWAGSTKNIVMSSCKCFFTIFALRTPHVESIGLNVFFIALPFAWAAHFTKAWGDGATFARECPLYELGVSDE